MMSLDVVAQPIVAPAVAVGMISTVIVVPLSATTPAYVEAVAPAIGEAFRNQRRVELPSLSPSI